MSKPWFFSDAGAPPRVQVSYSETIASLQPEGSKRWKGADAVLSHSVGTAMREAMRHDERTPPSADLVDGVDEQRRAPRFTLLIRAAKLTCPEGEFLCVVRDASEYGVSVRLFHDLPAGDTFTLELQNGDRHLLQKVWADDGRVGFRFTGPADIERIVESPSRFAKRAVRVNLNLPCTVRIAERGVRGELCNLSQQGAQITSAERLSLVQRIKLEGEGLPEVAAKVRWRRGDSYGLSFENNFQFGDLARIVFALQRNRSAD